MQNKINHILQKGKSKNAEESDRQEMFALFHRAENEYELKGSLLEELNNSKVPDTTSPDFIRIFEKLWAKIEKSKKQPRSKTRYLNTFIKVAAAVVIGLFIGLYITSIKNNQEPI